MQELTILELAQLRLLEVDNRVVVPAKSHLRIARPRRRIIGTTTPGRVSEPCNRRPFRAVRGALESAAGARQRLDPYPIFGPIPPSYYQKMRFLPNPSLLLQPLPN